MPEVNVNLKPVANDLFNLHCAECDQLLRTNISKKAASYAVGDALVQEHFIKHSAHKQL